MILAQERTETLDILKRIHQENMKRTGINARKGFLEASTEQAVRAFEAAEHCDAAKAIIHTVSLSKLVGNLRLSDTVTKDFYDAIPSILHLENCSCRMERKVK